MLDSRDATEPVPSPDPAACGVVGPNAVPPARDLAPRLLPGMVAAGHGVEFLCGFFGLVRAVLLDLVVELDLPTPHDRPLRKPGGRNPWGLADTAAFAVLWVAGWQADSLGARFGRSADACRSKARRLGLPKRDRKVLFRPASPGADARGDAARAGRAGVGAPRDASPDAPAPLCPPRSAFFLTAPAAGPVSPAVLDARAVARDQRDLFGLAPAQTAPKRRGLVWSRALDRELARRWWARQHWRSIARDMGLPAAAVRDRRWRLELPPVKELPPSLRPLVDRFDPDVVEANIRRAGYVERECKSFAKDGKSFWFWSKRQQCKHTSAEYERLGRRRANYLPVPARRRPVLGRRLPPPTLASLVPLVSLSSFAP